MGERERFPQEEREWGDRGIPGVTWFMLLPRGSVFPLPSLNVWGQSRALLWTWRWGLRQVLSPTGCGCSVSRGTGVFKAENIRVPEMPGASSSCDPFLVRQEETESRKRSHWPSITDTWQGRAWDPYSLRSTSLQLENWNSCRGASWAQRGAKPGERSKQAPLWPEPPQGRGRCCCGERAREGREEGKQ